MEGYGVAEHDGEVVENGACRSEAEREADVKVVLVTPVVPKKPPILRAHRYQTKGMFKVGLGQESAAWPAIKQSGNGLIRGDVLYGKGVAVNMVVNAVTVRLREVQNDPYRTIVFCHELQGGCSGKG